MNSYLCKDPALREALERCERINAALNLRDSLMEQTAAEALVAGRCAFLVSHCAWDFLAHEACHYGSLEQAQSSLRGFFVLNRLDPASDFALNSLVPLNNEAVSQLMDAYQRLGTFRTRRELMNRAFRIEGVTKPTVDCEGGWHIRPAAEIDGTDKRVIRAMESAQ